MSVYAAADELLAVIDTLGLSPDPMFVIDERHRIVLWNAAIQRLLGYDYDEVAGRSCGRMVAGDDLFGNRYCANDCAVMQIARRGDAVRQFQLAVKTKAGAPLDLDVTVLRFALPNTHRLLLAHIVRPCAAAVASRTVPQADAVAQCTDVRVSELTTRERVILSMLAAGRTLSEVAETLCIARLTARNHVQHIFRKLEVHSRSEAVAFAYRMHLVEDSVGA
jgi:PAS domain S-box-containing protein